MQLGISRQFFYHFSWRPVPKPVLGKIFARCGIFHTASFVGSIERKSSSLPLGSQPFLNGNLLGTHRNFKSALIEGTHFSNHRKTRSEEHTSELQSRER